MVKALTAALLVVGLFVLTGIGQGTITTRTSSGARISLDNISVPPLKAPANTLKVLFDLFMGSNDLLEVLDGAAALAYMEAYKNGPWSYTDSNSQVVQVNDLTLVVQGFGDYRDAEEYQGAKAVPNLQVPSELLIADDFCNQAKTYLDSEHSWGNEYSATVGRYVDKRGTADGFALVIVVTTTVRGAYVVSEATTTFSLPFDVATVCTF